ncbi:MAG: hypothetical protein PQJ45_10510 [Sphaerochaetaceae bacterium]|nr:hypothetical protein [Sphaerochaetaceae bacterium]
MKVRDVLIGLDGGATTTKYVLADINGNTLISGVGSPSNQGFDVDKENQSPYKILKVYAWE